MRKIFSLEQRVGVSEHLCPQTHLDLSRSLSYPKCVTIHGFWLQLPKGNLAIREHTHTHTHPHTDGDTALTLYIQAHEQTKQSALGGELESCLHEAD